MKYIIAVHAPQNHGKTTVIRNLWNILSRNPRSVSTTIPLRGSKRVSPEILGYDTDLITSASGTPISRVIGVNSRGDNCESIVGGLLTLYPKNPDIIVCACRHEPMLIKAINNMLFYSSRLPKMWENAVKVAHGGKTPSATAINAIQSDFLSNDWEIVLYSHFCDIPDKTSYMGRRHSIARGIITPRILSGTSIDLSEISAENIYDLIKLLL